MNQQERLRDLAGQGVEVATGPGRPAQRASTGLVLIASGAAGIWLAARNPAIWWVLPLALVAVDFLSGLVHWFFDIRVAVGTGRLGAIAVNFLDHHLHPARTAEVGFAATSWRVALYATLPLISAALLMPSGALQAWTFWLGALSLVVAQAHKEAHRRHPSAVARRLQRWRLALHPDQHRLHHRDHGRAYCVFTGWCNPLLDRIGFWHGLERIFR